MPHLGLPEELGHPTGTRLPRPCGQVAHVATGKRKCKVRFRLRQVSTWATWPKWTASRLIRTAAKIERHTPSFSDYPELAALTGFAG